jgi:hypothetical protein
VGDPSRISKAPSKPELKGLKAPLAAPPPAEPPPSEDSPQVVALARLMLATHRAKKPFPPRDEYPKAVYLAAKNLMGRWVGYVTDPKNQS